MSKVFIFGCGYLGIRLADTLIATGHEVGALTKNETFADVLRARGITEVIVDRLESHTWHSLVGNDYTKIINCVSSAGNGLSGYESSYYEGQASIIQWAKSHSIETFVYTSSTSVYPENSGGLVSEDSLKEDSVHSDTAQVLIRSENLIESNQSHFDDYFILRLSGIYGPKRHYLLNQIQSSSAIAGSGDYFMNMIHIDDIVTAIIGLINVKADIPSGIYNLSDDMPTQKKVVVEWLANELGIAVPTFDKYSVTQRNVSRKTRTKNRRIANTKIKQVMGLVLKYPTYKEGYTHIISQLS